MKSDTFDNDTRALPWRPGTTPLMLAPMQGLTNRAMRTLITEMAHPDTVFTEFVRMNTGARTNLKKTDLLEATTTTPGTPLVVQLIGNRLDSLLSGAHLLQEAGTRHLNLNLGCPYGRMTSGPTGGGVLREPERLNELIPALRAAVRGTFSIKIRAGYEDPEQIMDLLPLFETNDVDFLILHPRTVKQEYNGRADHQLTARVVAATSMPVIANGDIRSAADGNHVLAQTGAAGLMIGRGAIADPLLFERLRGTCNPSPDACTRLRDLALFMQQLQERYRTLFCGDTQVLAKLKAALSCTEDPQNAAEITRLKRAKDLRAFAACIEKML